MLDLQPPRHTSTLRIPVEDWSRFGSDSGHLVADPIGHEVRFDRYSPLRASRAARRVPQFVIRHPLHDSETDAGG